MPSADGPDEWELPRLRASFSFDDESPYVSEDGNDTEFFDVKFYPYRPVGAPHIFAAVSKKHAVVCRVTPSNEKDVNPCEVIQIIRDEDPDSLNCCCCWTRDAVTKAPYLCVSGRDAKVKVYDVVKGSLHATLVGHGGEINDLATSPENPLIIASASEDTTVRIWSLDPVHAEQPCVCILGGEGHSWNLLSVAFHETGRYVLSAGHDQTVNLWTLPDFPNKHVENPVVIYYPHFSTCEIHTSLVDCVAFFGDLIMSRACHEDTIVLWRVEGFSSDDEPPPASEAPTNHDPERLTRSSFATLDSTCSALYTRLLQFSIKGCGPQFFMRFSVFQSKGHNPVLAFCSTNSRIHFWDLARLTGYHRYLALVDAGDGDAGQGQGPITRPSWLEPIRHRRKGGEATGGGGTSSFRSLKTSDDSGRGGGGERELRRGDSPNTAAAAATTRQQQQQQQQQQQTPQTQPPHPEFSKETLDQWEGRYGIDDPQGLVQPHKTERFNTKFVGRQVAWSPDGVWCVVVGSKNLAIVLQRWQRDDAAHASERNTPAR